MSEEKKEFRCVICDGTEWRNVDEFRIKKEGMEMCTNCGFVSYPSRLKTEEELLEFYRKDYRSKASVGNIQTGIRKLHYHQVFLESVFKEWREKEIKAPVVGEVGSAMGMFLNMCRQQFMEADLNGTELTVGFRNTSAALYGIKLNEKLDLTKDYDLISSYKVAEHLFDIDKKLRAEVLALKPGGYYYIGVPIWFDKLCNFGLGGFDIEYYYSTNHINVWSRVHFMELLRKVGLKPVKQNHTMYDDVYLCVRDDEEMKRAPVYEKPEGVLQALDKIYRAGTAFMEGRYDDAVETWKNFPVAHMHRYEHSRAACHKKGWEYIEKEILGFAVESCPGSTEIVEFAGELHMRYKKYEAAIELFDTVLGMRPCSPTALRGIAQCHRLLAELEDEAPAKIDRTLKAIHVSRAMMEVSPGDRDECINWILSDCARIPTEVGLEEKIMLRY